MKNIIFIAPPAAGKGTQSELLKDNFNYTHISTGDMLRDAIATGSEFGIMVKNIIDKGNFVDDEIMIKLIKDKLRSVGRPFILDGFPRTLAQAEVLDDLLNEEKIDYQVIYLDLNEEIATKRVLGRLTCSCGKSYNMYFDELKPRLENVCDACGKSLVKRADDTEESFKKRYQLFINNTRPILDYYMSKGRIKVVDASRSFNEIYKEVVEIAQGAISRGLKND